MRQLYVTNRDEWRDWLSRHYATASQIWLVFYRKETGKPTIEYGAAVEEALCFGWIDSIIKRIDGAKYARKFTKRQDNSKWSALNKRRAHKMIKEGRMTEWGLAKIEAAKQTGRWNEDPRPQISLGHPSEFAKALAHNKRAEESFHKLAPSYRRHYIAWIETAKQPATREKRIRESILLLEKGERLGLR